MFMRGHRDHMVVDLLMLLITIPLSTMLMRGHRDHMVVEYTTNCAISAYHH
jgi:hypothetical protein